MPDLDDLWSFWTHGVHTIVESPERTRRIVHAGWGTLVEQHYSESEGWFHLPLPAPNQVVARAVNPPHDLSVRTALLGGARLKARLNRFAHIVELHLRAGEQQIGAKSVNLTGDVDEWFDIRTPAGSQMNYHWLHDTGLVLCVRVEFDGTEPAGQVIFLGAAAYYYNGI